MKISLKIYTSEPETKLGFPLYFDISHKGKRRKFKIASAHLHQFNKEDGTVNSRHPDFNTLYPIIQAYKIKAHEILLRRPEDVQAVYNELFKADVSAPNTFYGLCRVVIKDVEDTAKEHRAKKNIEASNKAEGNIKVYTTALDLLNVFAPGVSVHEIDFNLVRKFRLHCEKKGNKPATVSHYLRTLRALYNKVCKMYKLDDKKPFEGAFLGLKVKSYASRKKNASKETVRQIEGLCHADKRMHRWTDLWLLMFYLGGLDFIDLYYLKNAQLRKGRVWFDRGKGGSGVPVDIAVHPKAQAIIDKYRVDGEYLFPWPKDRERFVIFRNNLYHRLVKIQKRHGIELEGRGGNLGVKMARHTFATIGKHMGYDEDLLREIMGHERDDVDNNYKDRYPQRVRDEALFKIIE
jgi:site-specific recombinase XerD